MNKYEFNVNLFGNVTLQVMAENKEEAKEMVILIPGEKTQTNWENYIDLNFASGYNRKPVWKKEENLKYAGNQCSDFKKENYKF